MATGRLGRSPRAEVNSALFPIATVTRSMARGARHPLPTGSAFVRLLAALHDNAVAPSKEAFAQSLGRWVAWTDAISLSGALNAAPAPGSATGTAVASAVQADEREIARVRTALAKVAETAAGTTEPERARRPVAASGTLPPPADDFAAFCRRYVGAQQSMEAQVAPLRRRLRATLTGASPALARLAALDAVMEEVVGTRERELLATVPRSLEQQFDRLCVEGGAPAHDAPHETPAEPAAPPGPARTDAPTPRPSAARLATFRRDMRKLLLAELDLRLQPVEGLLDALRKSSP